MRRALPGLTVRGACFVLVGGVVLVVSLVLSERSLLRVAVVALALPLLAFVSVLRSRSRLSCERVLSPPRPPVGSSARVELRVRGLGRAASGGLHLEEVLPPGLAGVRRLPLPVLSAPSGGVVSFSYDLVPRRRGRFLVGPLQLRLGDPFGLCSASVPVGEPAELLVHPAPLPVVLGGSGRFARADGSSGPHGGGRRGEGSLDDLELREYRQGDDYRRIHWRASARRGDLVVRQEQERPVRLGVLVVVDSRRRVHSDDSFERLVSAAAGVVRELGRSGVPFSLVGPDGVDLLGGVPAAEGAVLDALALLEPLDVPSLLPVLGAGSVRGVSSTVLLVRSVVPADVDVLRALPPGGSGVLVVSDPGRGGVALPLERVRSVLAGAWDVLVPGASSAPAPAPVGAP